MSNHIYLDAETNDDGFFVTCIFDQVSCNKEDLPNLRQHSANERLFINDLHKSGNYVDKDTKFSLRYLELRSTIDMIGKYYFLLYIIIDKEFNLDQNNVVNKNYLKETLWFDGLQRQVKLRK